MASSAVSYAKLWYERFFHLCDSKVLMPSADGRWEWDIAAACEILYAYSWVHARIDG